MTFPETVVGRPTIWGTQEKVGKDEVENVKIKGTGVSIRTLSKKLKVRRYKETLSSFSAQLPFYKQHSCNSHSPHSL